MTTLDSGTTHCFLSEWITQLADLHMDTRARLNVYLADGEKWACFSVAYKVHVTFAPGVV